MNWLYERKMKDGGGSGTASQGGGQAAGPSEPEPYLDMEMGGGFGDSYSFLGDDTTAQGNGGNSSKMRHNFTYLNGQDASEYKRGIKLPDNKFKSEDEVKRKNYLINRWSNL